MSTDIVMPRLSDSMTEGTIVSWLKSVGDPIDEGEPLVEIETDKANMVFDSDAAGVVAGILAAEGETIPVGHVIARIGDAAEPQAVGIAAQSAEAPPSRRDGPGAAMDAKARSRGQPPASPGRPRRVNASPLARRLAGAHRLDLEAIEGSGPGGRVSRADVERILARGPTSSIGRRGDRAWGPAQAGATPLSETEVPPADRVHHPPAEDFRSPGSEVSAARGQIEILELSKTQQTVARRMAESKATAPHFYLSTEIEMTRCVEAREKLKALAVDGRPLPSLNDLVIKACAVALLKHPRVNGCYRDRRLELYSRINIGVAVAAPNGLVVPTIFDADRKGVLEIAAEVRELAEKVRTSKVAPPEVAGGTFTVSNLGMYGVSNFQAVLNSPQAAILAVGELREEAVVRSGQIGIGRVMAVTLSCDHRILYGADGAVFLRDLRNLLEEPLGLAL